MFDLGQRSDRRAALAQDPDDVQAIYGLGWTFHSAAEEGPAEDAFNQLIHSHPESPLGHRGLGSVRMARGDARAARESFEEALRLQPGFAAARSASSRSCTRASSGLSFRTAS